MNEDQLVRDVIDILVKLPEGRAKVREIALQVFRDPPSGTPVPQHIREMYEYAIERLRTHGASVRELVEIKDKYVAAGLWQNCDQEHSHGQ